MRHQLTVFTYLLFSAACACGVHDKQFVSAKYAVLLDFDSGASLLEVKSDDKNPPSSMTKLMTLYVLFSAISDGRVKLDDQFDISMAAQKMQGSKSFFQAGKKATVEDLIRSIIVHSGNDACIVVAEGVAGNENTFVRLMNEQAQKFGLKNTHFVNSTGMPDANHYSTVADIAYISKRIIADFPQFYHYFSEKEFTVNGITQQNRNTLLGGSLGVDGLKTGQTTAGGYGIAVSCAKHGKRLIAVVNGCKSKAERIQEASKLLSMGYTYFDSVIIAKKKEPITSVNVSLGKSATVDVCTNEDITAFILKANRADLRVEAIVNEPIVAPVSAGDKVGAIVYKCGGYVSKPYDLFACSSVEKLSAVERIFVSIKKILLGAFSKDDN